MGTMSQSRTVGKRLRSLQHKFDVVLMDIQMPIMDGLDATRAIRGENRKPAGTCQSSRDSSCHEGDREKCLSVGMDEYVAKPIRVGVVLEKLSSVLEFAGKSGTGSELLRQAGDGSNFASSDSSQVVESGHSTGLARS